MPLICTHIFGTTSDEAPELYKDSGGHSDHQENKTDFRYEIEATSDLADITELETFPFSQFINCETIYSQPNIAFLADNLFSETPRHILWNHANDSKRPSQMATSQGALGQGKL
jgi:hypothetical protein